MDDRTIVKDRQLVMMADLETQSGMAGLLSAYKCSCSLVEFESNLDHRDTNVFDATPCQVLPCAAVMVGETIAKSVVVSYTAVSVSPHAYANVRTNRTNPGTNMP